MELTSTAFLEGTTIPKVNTGDGKDISPPLRWSGAPANTQTFALICDDPDAPRKEPWVHWVLFHLPADARELPEAVPDSDTLAGGGKQGKNDFGKIGYGGPCPPAGPAHRYRFSLYALDTRLNLGSGATKQQALDAMQGHVLGQAQLTGSYQRRAA